MKLDDSNKPRGFEFDELSQSLRIDLKTLYLHADDKGIVRLRYDAIGCGGWIYEVRKP